MRVVENPFINRDAILGTLRPGQPASESAFRTLRAHSHASPGLRVDARISRGRLLGTAHLYSSLNGDAARAVRLGRPELALRLASKASQLEHSADAETVRSAVQNTADSLSVDPFDPKGPVDLQRYARLRRRSSPNGLDQRALVRAWLVQSSAWLREDGHGELTSAVIALDRAAAEARKDIVEDAFPAVSTFFGIVRRMDPTAVEIEGGGETRLVPRDELARQGLAVVGQAVALLCEELPAGGLLTLPMPAVALEPEAVAEARSPWEVPELDLEHNEMHSGQLEIDDYLWLTRSLAREPTAVPLAPLRRA